MSRETPEAVFAEARAAMARADWETFFGCLDRTELLVIAGNSVGFLAHQPETAITDFRALCDTHGFPLDELRMRGHRITESAQAMSAAPPQGAEAVRQSSERHMQLVRDHRTTLQDGLKAVPDLAGFTAALERHMRANASGGSVSSRLFVGETLRDLAVEGSKARGKRHLDSGAIEDIAFVKKKVGWFIKIPKSRV